MHKIALTIKTIFDGVQYNWEISEYRSFILNGHPLGNVLKDLLQRFKHEDWGTLKMQG